MHAAPSPAVVAPRENPKGDKYICDGLSDWHRVQDFLKGQLAKEPIYANGYARFFRAVRQRFQNWYVDEANGRPDGDGGWDAPWPSAEIAIEKIEQQATAAGVCPHGIIWTVAGVPKYFYDLPEPPSQPFDGSQPQKDFFEECEEAMQNAKTPNATSVPRVPMLVDTKDPRVWEKFRNNPMELSATDSLEDVIPDNSRPAPDSKAPRSTQIPLLNPLQFSLSQVIERLKHVEGEVAKSLGEIQSIRSLCMALFLDNSSAK